MQVYSSAISLKSIPKLDGLIEVLSKVSFLCFFFPSHKHTAALFAACFLDSLAFAFMCKTKEVETWGVAAPGEQRGRRGAAGIQLDGSFQVCSRGDFQSASATFNED